MPRGLHHVSVQTPDPEDLVWLMQDIGLSAAHRVDVPEVAATELLRWPGRPAATTATLYGREGCMVEVIDLPADLVDVVPPSMAMLTFAVRDVFAAAGRCRDRGLTVVGPLELRNGTLDLIAARVEASGLAVELVQYPPSAPTPVPDHSGRQG